MGKMECEKDDAKSNFIEKYQNEIGIISPFNKQVLKIKNLLGSYNYLFEKLNIEVNTIDRYQGRDKKIIIISFAQQFVPKKSSEKDSSSSIKSSILSDIRRINVAITRAKNELILI